MDAQALADMTASVAKIGVIQSIAFRDSRDGNLYIVAGERRDTAARTDDEKTNFQIALSGLREAIDAFHAPASAELA